MSTFKNLASAMRSLNQEIEEETGRIVRLVASTALEQVVRRTPVDEGTARSNYFVGLNKAVSKLRPAYSPIGAGQSPGLSEQTNANAAIAAGARVIRAFKPSKDKSIVISNVLHYIALLDEGYSKQAPLGFSEAAAQLAAKKVDEFKLR